MSTTRGPNISSQCLNKQSPRANLELFKQYIVSRGNVPALVLADQIHKAPAPGSKTVSKYPKVYHNQEGSGDTATKTFDAKELYGATALFEYPVMRSDEKPFEFETKKTPLKAISYKVEPEAQKKRFEKPINDPGPFRGITDKRKRIIGVVAHPEGDLKKHERAYLEPLNTQGRRSIRRYRERIALSRSRSWPAR